MKTQEAEALFECSWDILGALVLRTARFTRYDKGVFSPWVVRLA